MVGVVALLLGLLVWWVYKDHQRLRLSEALMQALQNRDVLKVQPLLDQGANPNQQTDGDLTPLLAGIGTGNLPVVRCLLDHGADPNLKNAHGMTPLEAALDAAINPQVNSQDFRIVRLLLDRGASVNELGEPVLPYAAARGDAPLVQSLLAHGADIHLRDQSYGRTPLARAVYSGHAPIVVLLLRQGAVTDINQPDRAGQTPLMYTAESGNASLVRLLLVHGANPNAVISKGPPTTDLDSESVGQTALMLAMINDQRQTAQRLLAGGAHVNVVAADGNTALSWAALKGHSDLVALLLAHGARSRLQNRAGHTPLALAQQRLQLLDPPSCDPSKRKVFPDGEVVLTPWRVTMKAWLQARSQDYDRTIRLLQQAPR